jgi:hypothetical protein
MLKIEANGHEFVEGEYKNRDSKLVIWCPEHNNEHSTTFYNYTRSRTGCPCCGKQRVSDKLKNRVYTPETLEKMQQSASKRPFRGGKPRRWREENSYRNWRKNVLKNYNNKCAITGFKTDKPGFLVVHHLYCAKKNPNLIYEPENGIVLQKAWHELFHKEYGYGNNTLKQFLEFLDILQTPKFNFKFSKLISSQANSEGLEGSETRAYDPERVMELQECLEKIDQKLQKLL